MKKNILSFIIFGISLCIQSLCGNTTQRLVQTISQEQYQPIADYSNMLEIMKAYPTLCTLLSLPAVQNPTPKRLYRDKEIDNCYLLKDHNNRVFETFKKQYPVFKEQLRTNSDIFTLFQSVKSFKTFFKAFLLLHDIGKPLGRLSDQHTNTAPLMNAYLKKWGYNDQQCMLALTLMNNDIFGDIALKKISVHEARKSILHNASNLNIQYHTLYLLHHLFWACDAGSYRSLKRVITTNKHGQYIPHYAASKINAIAQA